MKKKLVPLPIILSIVFSVLMMNLVGAQDTTMGVEPPNTVDEAFVGGSNITVEIWIRNVTDLVSAQFKLAYDSAVLNATSIEYGGIFGEVYFPLIDVINNTEGWLGYACGEFPMEPGFTGDGKLAIINFTVLSYGKSELHLYYTGLANSDAEDITHTLIDGYFSNKMPGDTDGDGDVDPFDFSTFRLAYGSTAGQESYDLECDLDQDGDVDPFDFSTFRLNYGRT